MTSISMKNSKGMLYHIVDSKKLEEFSSFPCMYLYSNIVNIVHILQLVTVMYYHNKKISRQYNMVMVKNCTVVSKILAIQIIFYEPRPTNITIPNSITLYAVPVYELHIYIFVALQQGRRMAMEIDESVQCGRRSSRFCSGKKCSHSHSHHQILTYLLLVRYIV